MIDFDKPRGAPRSRAAVRITEARQDAENLLEFEEIVLRRTADSHAAGFTARGRRINDLTGYGLVVIIGLAAIPMASARPVFWMMWSALSFLLLAIYMLSMRLIEPERPVSSLQAWPVLVTGLALPLAGLVQYALAFSGLTTSFAGHVVPLGTLAPEGTLMAVIRMLGLGALFILALEVATRAERVAKMGWALFTVVLLHAVYALFALVFLDDFVFWGEKIAYQGVATGTFVNRNSFATFLGMGMVTGICMILHRAHRPHTRTARGQHLLSEKNLELAALWVLVMIIAAALMATQSRMGIFASFLAAWFAYLVMGLKFHESKGATLARAVLLAVLGAGVMAYAFGAGAIERGLFSAQNIENRTDLYQQIFGMIREKPWLGTGLDSFRFAYELVHLPPVASHVIWDLAHSTYLTLWQEAGLIFGTLALISLGIATIMLIRIIRRRRSNYVGAVMALSLMLLVAIHSLLDFSLEIQANAMLFTVVLGIGLGRLRRREADT